MTHKIKFPSTKQVLVEGNTFLLHHYAGLFWEDENSLIISDTHFGKITHFRKSGLAIPKVASESNWNRLIELIDCFKPRRLVFLGDLFHSEYNLEWESFQTICQSYPELKILLVIGNHDILNPLLYQAVNIDVVEKWKIQPFVFTHHPEPQHGAYNIYGHIHPAIILNGKGKQRMKLPCFYFGKNEGILPAFGAFTGTSTIDVNKEDRVFAIAKNKIIEVSN